ncbi:MAG: FecR domain-containing protein [Bacteroidota bacterium]
MRITRELLEQYFLDNCTEEEKRAIERWRSSSEDEYEKLLSEVSKREIENDIWNDLIPVINKGQDKKAIPLFNRVTGYAAAAIILCTVGFFSYRTFSDNFEVNEMEQSLVLKAITTQRGEKRTVTLPDGSSIRMNYETEIQVPEKFEGNERVVYLTGHAHFDVARDTERPFIIYTKDTKTQVLGTSFDINTKGENETEIVVTSGKVAFSEKGKEDNLVMLTLNDRAILGTDKSISINKVNALRLTAWKDNQLIFDGKTLREIVKVLEPWYDIRIVVKDAALLDTDFKWSGDNPSLEILMKELSFAGRFGYQIEGKSVTIF